jgi:hypothetical protein
VIIFGKEKSMASAISTHTLQTGSTLLEQRHRPRCGTQSQPAFRWHTSLPEEVKQNCPKQSDGTQCPLERSHSVTTNTLYGVTRGEKVNAHMSCVNNYHSALLRAAARSRQSCLTSNGHRSKTKNTSPS